MARKEGEEGKTAAEPTGGRAEVLAASCHLPSGPCPSSPPGGVEVAFAAEAAAERRGCLEQRKSRPDQKAPLAAGLACSMAGFLPLWVFAQ